MNIILVEDDAIIADGLSFAFVQDSWEVTHCATLKAAREKLKLNSYDIALLDINLPDGNGIELCREIKAAHKMPVIFLTVCDDEIVTVRGLDEGADDYITKPFRVRELQSRIRAVLRRSGTINDKILLPTGLLLDTSKAALSRAGIQIQLTALEYKLLLTLAQNPNMVLNRTQLLQDVWDIDGSFVNGNTLSVTIKRLRKKIELDSEKPLIQTVRGLGYMLEAR